MTTFIFEIDIELKRTLGERKIPIKVEEEYAKLALGRRIIAAEGNEFITIASVRKKER